MSERNYIIYAVLVGALAMGRIADDRLFRRSPFLSLVTVAFVGTTWPLWAGIATITFFVDGSPKREAGERAQSGKRGGDGSR